MNERIINDLAVKSGLAEDMGRGYKFPDNYLDFAELIVRECAETIQDFVDHRFPASEYPVRLKRYFGVEE